VVLPTPDQKVILSARNLKKARVSQAQMLNTYEIMNANNLIIAESSVAIIEEILGTK
jgi:large subunit ribosomal protein L4